LGIGDWGLGPIPNPQSPIPNPQSPYIELKNLFYYIIYNIYIQNKLYILNNRKYKLIIFKIIYNIIGILLP